MSVCCAKVQFPRIGGARKAAAAQLNGWAVKSSKEEKERRAVKSRR